MFTIGGHCRDVCRDVEQYLGLLRRGDAASLRKEDRDGLNLGPALQLRLIYFGRYAGATGNAQEELDENQPVLWRRKFPAYVSVTLVYNRIVSLSALQSVTKHILCQC